MIWIVAVVVVLLVVPCWLAALLLSEHTRALGNRHVALSYLCDPSVGALQPMRFLLQLWRLVT